MYRSIDEDLLEWKDSPDRKPLILRGARQVGKSYTVEAFGRLQFESLAVVNLELRPDLKPCFDDLRPKQIVSQLELLLDQRIETGKTLLFLDEIQECPQAITALRYFKEQMPELHVIGAGSLLEFVLKEENFSFPVGRIQFMYLKPLSFVGFLRALGKNALVDRLKTISLEKPLEEALHLHLLELVKIYSVVGGMPEVVASYVKRGSLLHCQKLQETLLQTYQGDFGKYATDAQCEYLQILFSRAPDLVGSHIKYSKIDASVSNPARAFKLAVKQLANAGLIHQVYATAANGLPLRAEKNERKFKLIFLDVGLYQCAMGTDPIQVLPQVHNGSLSEQLVGQELLAYLESYLDKKLYFWEREKRYQAAEIDYVCARRGQIIPIEVKAGKTGRLRSMQQFLLEKKKDVGVRISEAPLSLERGILSVPFYLISELDRLFVGR